MTEVLSERHGPVAVITLNRPEHGNAINVALVRSLLEAVLECANDRSVRCVVLTGNGRMFCVGGDVKAFGTAGSEVSGLVVELTTFLHAAITRLMRMNKPIVTAINGPAAGAGLGLALLGDVVLASTRSRFSTAYREIGLTPDGGASWLLPRLVGLRRAQELALTARSVDAHEAEAIGLVTRTADPEALMTEAMSTATSLAGSAIGALSATRELLFASYGESLEGQLDAEARSIARSSQSDEAQSLIGDLIRRLSAKESAA